MNLIESCDGARAWHAIFKDYELPAEINMLHCYLEGNMIKFRFESPMTNRDYPERWKQEYNCFSFDLGFIDAKNLSISGLNFYGATRINATAASHLDIQIETSNCRVTFDAQKAYILNISGYYNERL